MESAPDSAHGNDGSGTGPEPLLAVTALLALAFEAVQRADWRDADMRPTRPAAGC